jgi:hypothetical protein
LIRTPTRRETSPASHRWRRRQQLLLALVFVLGAGAVLGGEASRAISTTRSFQSAALRSSDIAGEQQMYCWTAEVRRAIPRNSRVYVDTSTTLGQRLAGALVLWDSPLPTKSQAQWILSLVPSVPACGGYAVEKSPA